MMPRSPEQANVGERATVFDATTRLVPDALVPGQYSIVLDSKWSSLRGMHGGYLVAIAIAAAGEVVGDRPIRTVTTSFLRPAFAKPATVSVDVVRVGRSTTNLAVSIAQSAKLVQISQVTAADGGESTTWDTAAKLDLVPFEQCVPIEPPEGIGHFAHGVARLDPADLPFSLGPRARVAGYMRPIEPRPIDASWLGMALDWFPPAPFSRIDPPAGGISINYTIHVHRTLDALGDDEWLGSLFAADISAGGIALEKGSITDPAGRILAESFHTRWTAGPDQLPS